MVDRGGLEPPTSAVIGLERSATECVESHETAGVIKLEADPEGAGQTTHGNGERHFTD
jgi:hypothetical protein